MTKARYLAKEYMEQKNISSKEDIDRIVKGFDKINSVGIKATNYKLFCNVMVKILIFVLLCFIF